jgi:hypothetical protein
MLQEQAEAQQTTEQGNYTTCVSGCAIIASLEVHDRLTLATLHIDR